MRNKRGTTLIEVLTSVAIIGIISAIFITNYNQAGRRSDLQLATQIVMSDIRLAQTNALGLTEYSGAMPEGGWGMYFSSQESNNQEYSLFADTNNNKEYNYGEDDENLGGRIMSLPTDIVIDSVGTNTELHIVFIPPDPLTYINSNLDPAIITLRDLNSNITSTIRVNFAGLIEDL
jgi:prepilin-type N-terminal cleavage/methylation domain-containing protein